MKDAKAINFKQNQTTLFRNNKLIVCFLFLVGLLVLVFVSAMIIISKNYINIGLQQKSNSVELSSDQESTKVIQLNLGEKGGADEVLTLFRSSGFENVFLTSREEDDSGYTRFPQTIYIVDNNFSLSSLKKVYELEDAAPGGINDIQRITESGKFSNYWYATLEVYDDIVIFKNDGELISDSVCLNNQDVLKHPLCLYDQYDRTEEVIHVYNIGNPIREWEKVKIDPASGRVVP
jgi:hypothetical protein